MRSIIGGQLFLNLAKSAPNSKNARNQSSLELAYKFGENYVIMHESSSMTHPF
jgi:hypothetical protein